jgi:hypothetical protein
LGFRLNPFSSEVDFIALSWSSERTDSVEREPSAQA